jgi:hypothetical protein
MFSCAHGYISFNLETISDLMHAFLAEARRAIQLELEHAKERQGSLHEGLLLHRQAHRSEHQLVRAGAHTCTDFWGEGLL